MPYVTQLNGALVGTEADVLVVEIPPTTVLNDFGPSEKFDNYNVADDANGAETVTQGDFAAPVVGGAPMPGTYLGSGSLSTAGITVGMPYDDPLLGNLGLAVQLNPINGNFLQDEAGNVHMITDQPLNADHLGVTLTVKLPDSPAQTLNIPLSQFNDTVAGLDPAGLLAPLLSGVTDGSQYLLDNALVTIGFEPDGQMMLTDDQINDIVCFARGTLIETENGPLPVELLHEGCRVITRDHGAQPIRWIGSVRLGAAALQANPKLRPIRIRAGALGEGTPTSALIVSPQHRVLVRSRIAQKMFGTAEVLVAARQLLNLDGIDIVDDPADVEYFHFLFDRHEVVWSNGAATESLYTGPQALKSVGPAAREEIFALFPELRDRDHAPPAARVLASGRQARRLAMRHLQHRKSLVM
ncbi:MAG TPA: Hint domain-containing protein [Paracoccus sp. (in: a-proteobacteria)]|nr:Hint domain-containing protein [Paracoccus sp. (in: a-proteobacteria)]